MLGCALVAFGLGRVVLSYQPAPRPLNAEEKALLAGHRLVSQKVRGNDWGEASDIYVFAPISNDSNIELTEKLRKQGYTVKRMDFPGEGAWRRGSQVRFSIPRPGRDIGVGADNMSLMVKAEPSLGEKLWTRVQE